MAAPIISQADAVLTCICELFRMELLDPTLRLIADHCLQLETLRLGNFASQRQKAVCKALLALLPSFDSSVVADDWERCTVPLAVS